MLSHSPQSDAASPDQRRLLFLDALRAFGSISIMLHHFALYPPLNDLAAPLLGACLDWLRDHARTTQIFFGVSGYVLARSLSGRTWNLRRIGAFLAQRYCRLGIPYLATIALVLLAYALACGYLPQQVTGSRVTSWQLLTHLVFLQDILGQEQLSAGLWFVCINFQLCLMYALILGVRDSTGSSRFDAGMLLGWLLAAVSLFHVNLDPSRDAWALYFFPYFFMGVVVHRALRPGGRHAGFWLYQLLFVAALCVAWRWRLVAAMAVGAALFFAGATGWGSRWPKSRVVAWFGKISYSLFLVHFPVLVLVSTACIRLDWTSPEDAVAALGAAVALSIAAAAVFHRWVEIPAGHLARMLATPPGSREARMDGLAVRVQDGSRKR